MERKRAGYTEQSVRHGKQCKGVTHTHTHTHTHKIGALEGDVRDCG